MSVSVDDDYKELLIQIRNNQLEKLELAYGWYKFGEERLFQLLKELKGNKSVKEVSLCNCNLGRSSAFVLSELSDVLKVNTSVSILDLYFNLIGDQGVRVIAEGLKVNQCVKELYLGNNIYGSEGQRGLTEALKENGRLINCFVYDRQHQREVDSFLKRNVAMHKRARESVVYLLALRRMRRVLWIPKEIMVMIGLMLWKTKSDVEAWNKYQ